MKEPALGTFDAFIFDLDGTLLDTLPDLVALTNKALQEMGYPERTAEEIQSFIGHGVKSLLHDAMPEGEPEEKVEELARRWQDLYPQYGVALTKEYPGMTDALLALKAKGKKLGVLSNKFDGGVQQLIPQFFPGLFDAMHGVCEEIPRKPDPQGLLATIAEMGCVPQTTVYIGDSTTDIETARNTGVTVISVTWGYKPKEVLAAAEPDALIDAPSEITAFA